MILIYFLLFIIFFIIHCNLFQVIKIRLKYQKIIYLNFYVGLQNNLFNFQKNFDVFSQILIDIVIFL